MISNPFALRTSNSEVAVLETILLVGSRTLTWEDSLELIVGCLKRQKELTRRPKGILSAMGDARVPLEFCLKYVQSYLQVGYFDENGCVWVKKNHEGFGGKASVLSLGLLSPSPKHNRTLTLISMVL